VAKIEFHVGELFPRVGFIVTTLTTDSKAVVRFHKKFSWRRGTTANEKCLAAVNSDATAVW